MKLSVADANLHKRTVRGEPANKRNLGIMKFSDSGLGDPGDLGESILVLISSSFGAFSG